MKINKIIIFALIVFMASSHSNSIVNSKTNVLNNYMNVQNSKPTKNNIHSKKINKIMYVKSKSILFKNVKATKRAKLKLQRGDRVKCLRRYSNGYSKISYNNKVYYIKNKKLSRSIIVGMGTFKIYSYCPCTKCNGNSHRVSKIGTRLTQGRTIAVDPNVIPLGSIVYIKYNGKMHKFIAEDTGGKFIRGNAIDKFCNSHSKAYEWGIRKCKVWVIKKK